jgi:hypothetical protein
VRARRTKEAIQGRAAKVSSRIEDEVMAEYEEEQAVKQEEWATGRRMPMTFRDPRTGKLTGSPAPDFFIGPLLPTLIATLPHSMSEDEYHAAREARDAGTITPEQEAAMAEDDAALGSSVDDHWDDYNLRHWGHKRGPRGRPE